MSGRVRAPSVVACLGLLALIDVTSRLLGLRRTLRLVRRLAGVGSRGSDTGVVDRTVERLVLAAAFYPGRAQCLEQSLALYVLLRRRGVAADFRLGVQPLPFYAHAWVEVEGRPVNEKSGLPLQLATFAGLGV